MFCVLVRFEVLEGMESPFMEHWKAVTRALLKVGSLGSCLHQESGTTDIAYARWPTREMWQQERTLDPDLLQARTAMGACCTSIDTMAELEAVSDLLVSQA